MKRFGIVSYNIHCNFTNYGSALQSWALCRAVDQTGLAASVLIDYCPDILKGKDPLDPIGNMWDQDEEARRSCRLSLPAIRENYQKFEDFYTRRFERTTTVYTRENFASVTAREKLDGFLCGSDTIFCVDEFGLDDGYFAEYPVMKNGYTAAYAASFGDAHLSGDVLSAVSARLKNFKMIGLREERFLPLAKESTSVPCARVADPTLLLTREDYDTICAEKQTDKPYLLLYARRGNEAMAAYAEKQAQRLGLEIIEISLKAENAQKHRMFYEAGVEEFLSLIRHAALVVTNSFHGMLLSVQYRTPFAIFSREQCDNKIDEMLSLLGLPGRKMVTGDEVFAPIDFDRVHENVARARETSLDFLRKELSGL